jgi:hypothetical protein
MNDFILYNSSAFGTTIQDNLTILIDLDQNILGPTSKEVSRAVRHLCGFILPEDDLDPVNFDNFDIVAKEYYHSIQVNDPSGQNLLVYLAYLSGFFHELRHAHDLLSTTYGQDFLFQMLNLYQNTPSILSQLREWSKQRSMQPVPVPLKDNIPLLSELPQDILNLLEKYNSLQDDFRAFHAPRQRRPSNITVTHLLEGSAVDIQLDFIYDLFGEEAYHLLVEFIQNGDRSRLYLQIRQELLDIFNDRGFRGMGMGTVLNYLLWCALVSTTFPNRKIQEGPNSVILFEALVEYVSRRIKKFDDDDFGNLQELVIEFYDSWGFLPPKAMQARIQQFLSGRVERIEKTYQTHGLSHSVRDITTPYRSFAKAYEHMNLLIDSSPITYFGQRLYGWSFLRGLLPSIHTKVKIDGKLQDFMTYGPKVIDFEGWNYFFLNSSLLRFLMEGRSFAQVSFTDDLIYNLLTRDMKIEDRSALFNW